VSAGRNALNQRLNLCGHMLSELSRPLGPRKREVIQE
jgi:hypothetical protein